jgi:2',3'-cyclic-nucleotide 2'-phosphodiesterase (5'-nucleotidase family)
MDKVYKVAVNDYILGGGDGYAALGGGRMVTNAGGGNLVANDVMAHVEKLGSVKAEVEGRIKILGQ